MQDIVVVEGLTFAYEGMARPVLQNVSFRVARGEAVLILGPSGCGKSTLLLTLNGIVPQRLPGTFSGRVTVDGLDTREHDVPQVAEKVGLVFQDPEAQFCTLYVEDEVAFGLENLCTPRPVMQERVAWALRQVGLLEKAHARLDHLSGGEKQKVVLAATLAMDPPVLALDTPTANLDPASAREFWYLLARLKEELGKTLIIVEQQVDELMPLVDRVVLLDGGGQVIDVASPRELTRRYPVRRLTQMGIWVPQIWEALADTKVVNQGALPITVEEAAAEVIRALNTHAPPPVTQPPRPTSPPILTVQGLSYTYSRGKAPALTDVHLTLPRGTFCAIVGTNGAGKTTLAKCLTKILPPPPNTVFLDGHDIHHLPLTEVTRRVGYVFQNPEHQFVTDTVFDELAFGLRVRGVPEPDVKARVDAMLEKMRLVSRADAHPFSLSQGEKRRLSVATALIVEPDILILDEPTLGQDRDTALALMDEMRRLHAAGRTVIFITHDMRLVAEYAHMVVLMHQGRVLFQGAVEALFLDPRRLAQASLIVPPLVELAHRVRARRPDWPLLTSTRAWRSVLEAF